MINYIQHEDLRICTPNCPAIAVSLVLQQLLVLLCAHYFLGSYFPVRLVRDELLKNICSTSSMYGQNGTVQALFTESWPSLGTASASPAAHVLLSPYGAFAALPHASHRASLSISACTLAPILPRQDSQNPWSHSVAIKLLPTTYFISNRYSGPKASVTARDMTGFYTYLRPESGANFSTLWGDFLTNLHRKPGEKGKNPLEMPL